VPWVNRSPLSPSTGEKQIGRVRSTCTAARALLASSCLVGCAATSAESPARVTVPAAVARPPAESSGVAPEPYRREGRVSSPRRPPDPAGFAELGKHLYERQGCSVCHSVDGERKIGPTFKGLFDRDETMQDGSIVRVNDDYVRESIVKPDAKVVAGHPPAMPAYISILEEPQIRALIAYIVTLQ
jgi:mono/diheme cytochrome c family protein